MANLLPVHTLIKLKNLHNFENETFQNLIPTSIDMGAGDMTNSLYQFLFKNEGRTPKQSLPVKFSEQAISAESNTYITWYGHSAVLLEMDGKKILIDPMLGSASAPVSFTSKRFPYERPIPIQSLTDIDAIILSHDHYDHLDYESIMQLKNKVEHFYTALGVGSHLIRWGVDRSKSQNWTGGNLLQLQTLP